MKKLIAFIIFFMTTLLLTSCNMPSVYSKDFFELDTYINVNITTTNGKEHLKQIQKIYNDVDNYCNYYESYNNQSIYDLNNNREIEANDLLLSIITIANDLITKTNGYYNPLIGSLADKWKNAIKQNEVLDAKTIETELQSMENSKLVIEDNKITITGDANLDLGGIAKGYATNLVYEYLKENNITNYLINSGESNILLGESKKGYRVGLSIPFSDKLYGVYIDKNIAIATSSPAHQSFVKDDILYHHIISPFTGCPVNNFESVNIITKNSTYADAYSTAIFSMDLDTAKAFADSNDLGIILCDKQNIIYSKVDGIIEKI